MNNFVTRLFRGMRGHEAPGKMDRAYVSEFTQFIDHYLEEHPDVVKDQHVGRLIYWEKEVDLAAQEKAETDVVPDDGYGFYASAWNDKEKH